MAGDVMTPQERGLMLETLGREISDIGAALASDKGHLVLRRLNIQAVFEAASDLAGRISAGERVTKLEMRNVLSVAAKSGQ